MHDPEGEIMTKEKRQSTAENKKTGSRPPGLERIVFLVVAVVIVVGTIAYYLTTRPEEGPVGGFDDSISGGEDPMVTALIERFRANPDDLNTLRELGNYYYDSGNFAMAEMFYRKVLQIEPHDVDVMVDLGTAFYYSNRAEEAIRTYEQALEIDPEHWNALFNIGLVKNATGDREGAVFWWRKFIEVAGDDPHVGPIREMIEEIEAETEGGDTE
jgi:cytochrome c-type biogenesis protein CcmH/NrfG